MKEPLSLSRTLKKIRRHAYRTPLLTTLCGKLLSTSPEKKKEPRKLQLRKNDFFS